MLGDTNCNLHELNLHNNDIGVEGAISIANVQNAFVRLLCNTDSINNTYLSNHTLEQVTISSDGGQGEDVLGKQLKSLLKLNVGTNQSHVAIKKILQYHPNIDMEPLFGWDKDGEWTLKSLPYVVAWFERACAAKAAEVEERRAFLQELEIGQINRRTLSSIYKFAKAMPLRFVPTGHAKTDKKKRKRVN